MGRVVVVTDSVANLPKNVAQELGIRVVPLMVHLEGEEYRDEVDISAGEVYRRQRLGGFVPSTSTPQLGDFVQAYNDAAGAGDAIVSIHVSDRLSATMQAALDARDLVDFRPIHVLSLPTGAMGEGLAVLEAARAAARGESADAVIARAEEIASKVTVLIIVDTLEYLRKGGRIGGAAALLGSLLNMKPVLQIVDGVVDAFGRARSKPKAVQMVLDAMSERVQESPVHVGIFHADVLDEAEALRDEVRESFNCVEILIADSTPVIGSHLGPGVLGLAFYAD